MRYLIWLLALIFISVHILFSSRLHDGKNEMILADAVASQLKESHPNVAVRYDYLDGHIEGYALSAEARTALGEEAAAVKPAGRIFNHISLPELPASLQVRLSDDMLTLAGEIPTTALSESLQNAVATSFGGHIENKLNIDPNVMLPEWAADMPKLLARLVANTDIAELDADSDRIRLMRTTPDAGHKSELLSFAKKLGSKKVIDQIEVVSNALRLRLQDGTLSLWGTVPDSETSTALEAAATASGAAKVENYIDVRSDLPKADWAESTPAFITDFFKGAKSGEVEISNQSVRVDRAVETDEEMAKLTELAATIYPDGSLDNQLHFSDARRDFELAITPSTETKSVRLEGWLPSEEIKQQLVSAVTKRFDGQEVDDKISVAPNVKLASWAKPAALEEFIAGMPVLDKDMPVSLTSSGYTLPELDYFAKLGMNKHALNAFGREFPNAKLPTKPARLLVNLDEGVLKLAGYVPTPEFKDSLNIGPVVEPKISTDNQIAVDTDVVYPEWADQVDEFLAAFVQGAQSDVEFELDGKKLRLKREFETQDERLTMAALAKSTFPTLDFVDQLSVTPPPAIPEPPIVTMSEAKSEPESTPAPEKEEPMVAKVEPTKPEPVEEKTTLVKAKPFIPETAETKEPMVAKVEAAPTPTLPESTVEVAAATPPAITPPPIPPASEEPQPAPEPEGDFVKRWVLIFATGSTWINPDSRTKLQEATDMLKDLSGSPTIQVRGFASRTGNQGTNAILSRQRAEGVTQRLVENGVPRSSIILSGEGEVSYGDPTGDESWDRRVEVKIFK